MRTLFPANIIFRLLCPLVYGTLMYVLVLIIFDSVSDLLNNFFSREWIFCVILTYACFEGVIIIGNILYHRIKGHRKIFKFAVFLFPVTIIYIIIIVSLFIHIYFLYFVGFTVYYSELYIFCFVFVLSVILFNLFIISYLILRQDIEKQQEAEKAITHQSNLVLRSFKNELDPEFLNQMLECLLVYIRQNDDIAQYIIIKMSELYSLRLKNKYQEWIEVELEIEQLRIILNLLKYKYDRLLFNFNKTKMSNNNVIFQGVLCRIIQIVTGSNIITNHEEFAINIEVLEDCVKIKHKNRLKLFVSEMEEIKILSNEMNMFDNEGVVYKENDGIIELTIPVLFVENEVCIE